MVIVIWSGKTMYNIGDMVVYRDYLGERKNAKICEVSSDMDSYEDMRLKDGVPYYASKKITAKENKERKKKGLTPLEAPIYVPVKEKNMSSVFFTVKIDDRDIDYVMMKDIL